MITKKEDSLDYVLQVKQSTDSMHISADDAIVRSYNIFLNQLIVLYEFVLFES
jgi:hypothetical protein